MKVCVCYDNDTKGDTLMDNERTKVMLMYTKVLLMVHGIKDASVDEALDIAIEAFDKNTLPVNLPVDSVNP